MRILIGHNHYQIPGGEDAVVKAEHALLKDFGQDVVLYERSNAEINSLSLKANLSQLWNLGWAQQSYDDVKSLIKEFRPDVAHFHNIFYMISPSVYFACKDAGVPVIQSQHNFRLLCPNGLFSQNNRVCEGCVPGSPWKSVVLGCYKNSRMITAFTARMLSSHWKRKTWVQKVDCYITGSEFARQKYIQGGIPAEKIMVKPNFVYPDPGRREEPEGYALYVGRLSQEKGVGVLLEAWKSFEDRPLRIIGEGPLADSLQRYVRAHHIKNVTFLGYVDHETYEKNMRGAAFLAVPSQCYENFPRTVAEAFSYGIPVVASRMGSLEEIIEDKKTGLLFQPGDPSDLVDKIKWMFQHPDACSTMREAARHEFETKYIARENYERLMGIYQKAIDKAMTVTAHSS